MATNSNRTSVIVAIIGAVALIITAIIQIHPWRKDAGGTVSKSIKTYILRGTVINEKSNQSISQAEINVVGRNEQYYSENNGNFEIIIKDSVKSIRVRVEKNGFLPYDKSYDLPNENVIIQLTKKPHD
ncbi:MAG TPA: carboxypeptidase-like regulatory domain-containing protein [Mucilaginibacter sp.]|nr:carboxypeptidase-like regulatory domain-containing protein [Mucilaginibacter sp.]